MTCATRESQPRAIRPGPTEVRHRDKSDPSSSEPCHFCVLLHTKARLSLYSAHKPDRRLAAAESGSQQL